jgi:hypothetical protein
VIAFLVCSAMGLACNGAEVAEGVSSSQGLVATAAAAGHEIEYATAAPPRRMTPDEIASLQAVHPERVQPPIAVLRQNFENAYSALASGQGGTEFDRRRLFLAVLVAARSLPAEDQSTAQAQIAAFIKSGPGAP